MSREENNKKVKDKLATYKIEWLGEEFNSIDSILRLKCSKGHVFMSSLDKVNIAQGCPECAMKEIIRETESRIEQVASLPPKRGKRLLAMDQATRVSGYSIFEDDRLIAYGVVEADTSQSMFDRIKYFNQWLEETIKSAEIDAVALERVQFQGNAKTLIDLARLLGSLEQTAARGLGREPLGVLASQWKSTCDVTGKYRKEQKKNAQLFVRNQYGINASSDAADAICIGHHAVRLSNLNKARSISSNKLAF